MNRLLLVAGILFPLCGCAGRGDRPAGRGDRPATRGVPSPSPGDSARGRPIVLSRPAPGVSREVREKIDDLARRLREQRRNLAVIPPDVELISPPEELSKFCSTSDLVAVTFSEDNALVRAAFSLLRGSSNSGLTGREVAGLLRHIEEAPAGWKAGWAASALGANGEAGVPALAGLLEKSRDPSVRVNCAWGLVGRNSRADAALKRKAQLVLLESLANEGDSSRVAHNSVQPLEPWMAKWLIERLSRPDAAPALRKRGTSLLAHSESARERFGEEIKRLFVGALEDPSPNVRISAVQGLRGLGLNEADLELYRRILGDENAFVREMLYWELGGEAYPWAVPLLMAGLKDDRLENRGICARGLGMLRHKPALPGLIRMLGEAPQDPRRPFDEAYRRAGEAAVKIAGLEGYDFERLVQCESHGRIRAHVIVNRGDVYQKECARLLKWWESENVGDK